MFDSLCVNYLLKLQLGEKVEIMQRINQKRDINDILTNKTQQTKNNCIHAAVIVNRWRIWPTVKQGADATEGSRACSVRKWVKAGEHPSL